MAFAVVYGAEHFVIDVFVGWAYAAVTFVVGSRLLDRWEARRARRSARAGDTGPAAPALEGSETLPQGESDTEPAVTLTP